MIHPHNWNHPELEENLKTSQVGEVFTGKVHCYFLNRTEKERDRCFAGTLNSYLWGDGTAQITKVFSS